MLATILFVLFKISVADKSNREHLCSISISFPVPQNTDGRACELLAEKASVTYLAGVHGQFSCAAINSVEHVIVSIIRSDNILLFIFKI